MRPFLLRLAAAFLLITSQLVIKASAQAPKTYTSSEILLGLKKLNVLGSVLYIAAHPDDENTRLLAYLANERLLETAYLSCTRGDGGQNLIGPELREQLGVIRTQELLAARRIDGAQQFFTRANDFGFSKTSDETFTIWDKEQVLADMVWVIRQRRPDVLITRFPPDARAGHGHHQASAILAIEAFSAAGDAKRFPEQLQYVQPWQPRRLLWNTGSFFVKPGEDMSGFLKLDAGGYNPLLGKSYGELAALSRSQHRSQGMGTAAQRGESLEYFQTLRKEDALPKELFEGVDMSWNRVPGGAKVGKLVEEVIRKFDAANPAASVAGLQAVDLAMDKIPFPTAEKEQRYLNFWRQEKRKQLQTLMQACFGLYLEVSASYEKVTPGQPALLSIEAISRNAPIKLTSFEIWSEGRRSEKEAAGKLPTSWTNRADWGSKRDTTFDKVLTSEKAFTFRKQFILPPSTPLTQPYWLREPSSIGMYAVGDQLDRGKSEEGGPAVGRFGVIVGKDPIRYFHVPVQYKHTDPVLGELYQPLAVVPPVAVNLPAGRAYVFSNLPALVSGGQGQQLPVTLRAGRAGVAGTVTLQVPAGWQVEPVSIPFTLKNKDEEQVVTFTLRPTSITEGRTEVRAVATVEGQPYSRGLQPISYPHIPTQTLFPEATAPLVKLNVSRGKAQTVGYLPGAGDEVPEALRQLGYTVTLLDPATDLTLDRLRRYDAVVLGIRAYNTVEKLKSQQAELLKYAEQGGNVVVQYTVTRGALLPQIGPYPLTLSNNRITVENTPVKFLDPKHPLLNSPNKLTPEDFSTGWVQEQGLYYPSAWDAKYTPVIASHDPGEAEQQSAILVADYGKGHYIYTGLSLFRELPAGVPGAYRVLANLVSYGK
jgi:LmbE family N-acetylglucosaminyl deacetylase